MKNLANLLATIRFVLNGKKTYLTGIAAVCTGIANNDLNLIFTGLSAIFIRNGIAKV